MRWEFWRIATSEHMRVSLKEIENEWTLIDVLEAHQMLDALEEAASSE